MVSHPTVCDAQLAERKCFVSSTFVDSLRLCMCRLTIKLQQRLSSRAGGAVHLALPLLGALRSGLQLLDSTAQNKQASVFDSLGAQIRMAVHTQGGSVLPPEILEKLHQLYSQVDLLLLIAQRKGNLDSVAPLMCVIGPVSPAPLT